jgi:cytochrome d ubiquinol oxidase subunit II
MTEYFFEHLWYFVIAICAIAYVVLDGFDLGVGMLSIFNKKDEERRLFLNSIGPVWDGNEVWLVVFGGALFAGFPPVYATIFSGFYDLAMLFLAALIFRAVAIEFRSKQENKKWRSTWDYVFAIASFGIAFGAGLVLGNLVKGISIDVDGNFVGTTKEFFHPYPILVGCLTVALFAMHGAIYLVMKTEGYLQEKLRLWAQKCMVIFFFFYFVTTVATLIYMPFMAERMRNIPWVSSLGLIAFIFFFSIPKLFSKGKDGTAFIFSCLGIASLLGLFGIGTYPVLVRSSLDPVNNSLTLLNSASSYLTLKILLIIVVIGVPMVLGYGFYIYRIFRGKVKIGPSSY